MDTNRVISLFLIAFSFGPIIGAILSFALQDWLKVLCCRFFALAIKKKHDIHLFVKR